MYNDHCLYAPPETVVAVTISCYNMVLFLNY